MALDRQRRYVGYGLTQALTDLASKPIVADRAPTAADKAEIGTLWCDRSSNAVYCLVNITAGASVWTTSPASGSTILTDLTITGGVGTVLDVQAGDVSIGAGNLAVVGDTTMTGNLSVVGDFALTGDFDIVDTGSISLTSTNNAAQAIYLHADGGVLETIDIHSDQGTAVNSVNIHSDVGGLTLASGLASADAINLAASAGGVDIDGALQVNIASSQNAGNAIVLNASAGAIDILAAGAAGEDIDISNTAGSINVTAGEAVANALVLSAPAGGLDVNVALQMNLDSAQVAADAIRIIASDVAGGIDIDAGTAGIAIDSTGAVSLQGAATSDFSVSGAGIDLTLASAAGRVVVNGEEAAADALRLLSAAGGLDVNVALQMNLDSSQVAADALRFVASDVAGGIDIDAGTAGITIDSTGAISLDGAAASNFTVTGAFDLTASSTAGSVIISGGEAVADAIQIIASNAAGGIDLSAGTGLVNVDNGVVITGPATTVVGLAVDTSAGTGIASSFTSVDAVTDAIEVNNGGIKVDPVVDGGGASPRVVNARFGTASFSDVINAAATGALVVTNSMVAVGSVILANASCATVGSAVLIRDYVAGAGTVTFNVTNLGGTNTGANIIIDFWILS